jgi:Cu+-exporting ATPase
MQTRAVTAALAALFLAGCAATTPAPRFSAVSPADEDAPEAGAPPPAPALAGEPEAQAAGHEGQASSAATSAGERYACPMHPEVQQASPGSCPKCGMPLERRGAKKQP